MATNLTINLDQSNWSNSFNDLLLNTTKRTLIEQLSMVAEKNEESSEHDWDSEQSLRLQTDLRDQPASYSIED